MRAQLRQYTLLFTLLASCFSAPLPSFSDPVVPIIIGGIVVVSGVAVGSSLGTLALVKLCSSKDPYLPSWARDLSDGQQQVIREARALEDALDMILSDSVALASSSKQDQLIYFYRIAQQLISSGELVFTTSYTNEELPYFSYALVQDYLRLQVDLSHQYIQRLQKVAVNAELAAAEHVYAVIKDLKRVSSRLKHMRMLITQLPEYFVHKDAFELHCIISTFRSEERRDCKFYRQGARSLGIRSDDWHTVLTSRVESLSDRFDEVCEHAQFCAQKYENTSLSSCYGYIEKLPEYGEALKALVIELKQL